MLGAGCPSTSFIAERRFRSGQIRGTGIRGLRGKLSGWYVSGSWGKLMDEGIFVACRIVIDIA